MPSERVAERGYLHHVIGQHRGTGVHEIAGRTMHSNPSNLSRLICPPSQLLGGLALLSSFS